MDVQRQLTRVELAVGSLCVASALYICISSFLRPALDVDVTCRMRMASNTTWAVGTLLWPVVWLTVVGSPLQSSTPLCWFGFCWPLAMGLLDIALYTQQDVSSVMDGRGSRSLRQMDVNAVVGFLFGVSGFVSSSIGRNASRTSASILAVALVLCIAFVMPTPEVQSHNPTAAVLRSGQKIVLHWAIGLMLAVLCNSVSFGAMLRPYESKAMRDASHEVLKELGPKMRRGAPA